MNVPGLKKRSNEPISLMIFFLKKYQGQQNCLYLCAFGNLAGQFTDNYIKYLQKRNPLTNRAYCIFFCASAIVQPNAGPLNPIALPQFPAFFDRNCSIPDLSDLS
jgi:hypothetical protein